MFGKDVSGSPQKGKASGEDLCDRLRKKLASRGARGIIGLSKQFRIMDDNHSMSLDRYEFKKAMSDYMLGFSEGELDTLFRYFDWDKSGLIEYNEFLRQIRGPMNAGRKAIVAKAFDILDKDGSGVIDLNDITGVYNAKGHPDVLSGKKTEQQILQEFLETFETHHNSQKGKAADYSVTRDEFEEYYNNISCSIDNDEYFALMMNNAWNLDGKKVTKKGWSNKDDDGAQQQRGGRTAARGGAQAKAADLPPMNYTESQLMDVFRKKLASRGARGIMGLGRQFKIADDNRSMSLDMEEFKKCVHDFRVGLKPNDSEKLFKIFDRTNDGAISYDEFLRGVRGEMNDFRKNLAQ